MTLAQKLERDFRSIVMDVTPDEFDVPASFVASTGGTIPAQWWLRCVTLTGPLPDIDIDDLPDDEPACREWIRAFLSTELQKQAAADLAQALE